MFYWLKSCFRGTPEHSIGYEDHWRLSDHQQPWQRFPLMWFRTLWPMLASQRTIFKLLDDWLATLPSPKWNVPQSGSFQNLLLTHVTQNESISLYLKQVWWESPFLGCICELFGKIFYYFHMAMRWWTLKNHLNLNKISKYNEEQLRSESLSMISSIWNDAKVIFPDFKKFPETELNLSTYLYTPFHILNSHLQNVKWVLRQLKYIWLWFWRLSLQPHVFYRGFCSH